MRTIPPDPAAGRSRPVPRPGWLVLVLLSAATALPAAQTSPTAAEVARRVQAHFDSVRDFRADFTQEYRGAFMSQPAERGKVLVKKPGLMRWTYAPPRRDEYWSDGTRIYSYDAGSRQGTISPLPQDDNASAAVLFLLGRGDLSRDFTPALAAQQPAGEWRLELTPKRAQPDFVELTLIVDRRTLQLRGLIKQDLQGGTETYRFLNLQENVGLPDREFRREFPKGTEIIR